MNKDILSVTAMIKSLTHINELFSHILSIEEPKKVLTYLLSSLNEITTSSKCQLLTLNDTTPKMYFCDNCLNNSLLIESKFNKDIKYITYTLESLTDLLVSDISVNSELYDAYIKNNNISSLICIPLITNDKVFALLCLENPCETWFHNNYIELLHIIKNNTLLLLKTICSNMAFNLNSIALNKKFLNYCSKSNYDLDQLSIDNTLDISDIMLNNIKESFCFTSYDGTILYATSSYENILGVSSSDIIGHNFYEFISAEYRHDFRIYFRNILNNKDVEPFKCTCVNAFNKTVWIKIFSNTLNKPASNLSGIVFTTQDITEEISYSDFLVKETKEQNALRNDFFTNISHELRTPVNIIYTTLQLLDMDLKSLRDPTLYAKFTSRFKGIKQNCFRLMRLINNILDVTKIDSGFFNLNLSKLNIISLIEDMTLSVASYVESKNLSFIFDTNIEEKFIACDPDKIERILLNLISNSVKYTPSGGSIYVTINSIDDYVAVSVKDTGKGIPLEDQLGVFDRFVQSHNQINCTVSGSGIGLNLVKSLVELHGGTITLESTPNEGCEFIFTLPNNLSSNSYEYNSANTAILSNNIQKIKVELSDIYV